MRVVLVASFCVGALTGSPDTAVAEDAQHVRLATSRGPVHVWTPPDYDPKSARLVVYVHGFYIDVDHAWRDHALPAQFAESKLPAMFVACAAPSGPSDPITWTSLEVLLATVKRHVALPEGEVVVVGHSGASWTLRMWLARDRIDTVVLLDGVYGDIPQLRTWLEASDDHRLVDIAELSREWADDLHAALPASHTVEELPATVEAWRELVAAHRILYVHSRIGHMQLVTNRRVIPMVLEALQPTEW